MKLHRSSGTSGPSGPTPSPDRPGPGAEARSASPTRGTGSPADSVYTQARSTGPSGSAPLSSSLQASRPDPASVLRGRPQQRAHEMAQALASAPPDVKGAELARVHGEAALRRAQRLLAPVSTLLTTRLSPAARGDVQLPPARPLNGLQQAGLRSACGLALDSLRLEDLLDEPISTQQAARMHFQLDLTVLGGRLDEGYAELRAASQRALAALRP